MARRPAWRSALLVVAAGCAGELVTAPGACPDYCIGTGIQAADTVMATAVRGDSTFRGYLSAPSAGELQIASGDVESRGIIHFFRFGDRVQINSSDTATAAVAQTDSVQFQLDVRRHSKGVGNLRLLFYRIPLTVDTNVVFDSLALYFADSMLIGEAPVETDTVGIMRATFLGDRLPTFQEDSFEVAIGLAVRGDAPGFVSIGAADAGRAAQIVRYVQIDSVPGTRVKRTGNPQSARFDTYVFRPPAPPGAGVLAVGGAPSARTFVRLAIPKRIVDSSYVVRATLLLIPAEPVIGAAGDTLRIVAHGVSAELGPKSPVVVNAADTSAYAGGRVASGTSDTVQVDVTEVVRSWRGDTLRARTLVLRALPEAASWGEIRFWSSADPARRPLLDVTYVPPLKYQGR